MMNNNRNFEDVMMSVVKILWESDYSNDIIAQVLADMGCRLILMEESE